ncbi:putative bifunctional diguanylate cyclase/phosphodiesterase [Amantichitinum ursilacus]|uniref:Cyclic di-GMP phosphodiesterase Gmr n=1 Tax=Amantichitinum ursilacus TaxID=857265 RepID=A0A0N0GQ84_9NEIS|nr:EAL domain-containing protein [Amantichitinum ursilacus]KPC54183.1 Cyclic di-GMP phosphodiesterase Gmr [Amantichitinum ursilacus]
MAVENMPDLQSHPEAPRNPRFDLVRYFFWLSLVLMGVATVAMAGYLRYFSSEQMLQLEKVRAASLVQVFENSLWPHFKPLTQMSDDVTRMRAMATQEQLQNNVVHLMQGTDVVRLKVYALDGMTVFSTDPRQVGESEKGNDGFESAVANTPVSELAHRNSIDAFDRQLTDRDLISTYVPVHGANGKVEGVLEIYVDATAFVSSTRAQLTWLTIAIILSMIALYIAQMLVVKRAGNIIKNQAAKLVEINRELDQRVELRTQELGDANRLLEGEIEERRNAEERLHQLAHHDPLTSLPNRLLFKNRLEQALATPPTQHHLAVLFLDLDRFKDVNDTLGHFIGDQLLIAVAERLIEHVRPGDTLARIGGDEFVCILAHIENANAVNPVAERLLSLFNLPFRISDNDIHLSASIGVSFSPQDGTDFDALVRKADIAMYQAKALGRNRYQMYTHQMSVAAEERVLVERHLRRAIAAQEIAVYFQPKVDSISGKLVGAEALARWTDPVLGVVPPSRFIPVAEDSGLIIKLGQQVLEKTCQQIAQWRADGFAITSVSVNLSVKQLELDDFAVRLAHLLETYDLPASVLELEITESVIMAVADAFSVLEAIRALGVKLSIDDFGTGYSSLAYLKQLPVDILKIDRAFVTGIGTGIDSEAIIRTIIGLARSLGLRTVAEGVEERAQVDFLQREGCTTIQGYFYGRPQAAALFVQDWQARNT